MSKNISEWWSFCISEGEKHGCSAEAVAYDEISTMRSCLRDEIAEKNYEIAKLKSEIDYAYRVIHFGFTRGDFDFTVLKMLAENHMGAVVDVGCK